MKGKLFLLLKKVCSLCEKSKQSDGSMISDKIVPVS